MFEYERVIFLGDTDATGVLYFPAQFRWAGEAFEAFLQEQSFFLNAKPSFLLPVVHAEGDYHAPLRVGERVVVELFLEKMGTSSFTLISKIKKDKVLVGEVKTVHVLVGPKGQAEPIPEEFSQVLRQLSP